MASQRRRLDLILLDVDTQVDFMSPQGALYVPGAEEIVPNLKRIFAAALEHDLPVVSSADWHAPDDGEFEQYGFPPHCVRGTAGQEKLPETLLPARVYIDPDERVEDVASLFDRYQQIIFNKTTFSMWSNPNAERLLQQVGKAAWYVMGVATDYCVKAAAIHLAEAGQSVFLVTDAVRAVSEQTSRQALQEMQQKGVSFVTTDDLLGSLHARS